MRKKLNIWDIIAWVVLAGILIWLVLKSVGIINTLIWLEYAPLYGAVYLAGWQIHKLGVVASDVRDLKKFRNETIKEINNIKTNCIKRHIK